MHSSVNKNESRTFFGHPYPLGSLFFTEMWERFSFYGIRPLLILFMAATVYDGGMGPGARERLGDRWDFCRQYVSGRAASAAGWRITGLANNAPSGTALS